MSKRKTITQAFHVTSEDMTFEDQDGIQDDLQSEKESESSRSRFSGRAKKVKAIYDPSEHNGPVHKRKKEAMEAAERSKSVVTKSPAKVRSATVSLSPAKREVVSNPATRAKIVPQRKTPADVVKRLSMDEILKPIQKIHKLSVPIAPLVKEPSKRIQQRKVIKTDVIEGITSIVVKKQRSRSVSIAPGPPSIISSTYDEASTVSVKDGEVPDVRTWTHQQVGEYFCTTLKFSKRDAAVFKDEEIDGETLLIMKRSDIVTTKFQHLKLGTALKMWSHILQFQTLSTDPSQAWK